MQLQGQQGQTRIVGKYRYNTSDVLGKGSFGVVYKCTHIETQEELALKIMPRPQIQCQEDLNKEIDIMAKLKGPNIVRFREVLGTANNIYIVIDLCDFDLYKQLKQKKMFKEKEAIKIMTDVLNGFLELIENGIIHRDVKPANILIKNDVYKLADFGFARIVDDFTNHKFSTIIGTPMYMSPQILEGSLYTTKSDIWSFGFIFYEILYGKTPWFGNSHVELLKNIKEQDLTFSDETIKVSDIVKDVLSRCLAKKEADRITWIELFRHPVFCEKFQEVKNLEQRCNRVEQFIATNLRLQIANQNISIEHLIKVLKIEELNPTNLEMLFYRIDKSIQKLEVQYLYQQIKQNPNKPMTIDDLKAWLNKFEIPIYNVQRQNKQNACLYELKDALYKFKQTLQQYFNKFNKKQDGKLGFEEFKLLILKINQNFNDQKIQESFTFIDKDDKGFVTIEEFQRALDNLKG